jgi:hypothetical protein
VLEDGGDGLDWTEIEKHGAPTGPIRMEQRDADAECCVLCSRRLQLPFRWINARRGR